MISPFAKSFDELLNGLLTDYENQSYLDANGANQQFDISQGTLTFIKSACLASALWGVHQAISWTGDQIFPDSATAANLQRHAWLRGLTPTAGETDAQLLSRLLDDLRRPPAGGNRHDYVKWALSIDGVEKAWCYPLARGNGTVDVLVQIRSGAVGATVLSNVATYIESVRPVGPGSGSVEVSSPYEDPINITLSGINGADPASVAADIKTLLNSFEPDQHLYKVQLAAVAIAHGAVNPTITAPPADVEPSAYHMIRPGTVTIDGVVYA